MSIPETLATHTDAIRAAVEQANQVNWRNLPARVESEITTICAYVILTPEIALACEVVASRCRDYAEEIGARGPLYARDDRSATQARQLALLAVEELEDRLEIAKPSDKAIKLGIGW